ncbi:MAG: hypothetical protein BWY43_00235 [candidate division WS2 bacterium ADurb.Bin280]|uniref:Uncharacterized protein n=1 Tax=candidate division WS2 bacterium ADurb.Bin280 TaxID=1852829 RepID=A0A1V5SEH7_9BACT|nr:MAG: hypothetical protein BWY43_00235 [candidate division WS2 bacterium ADurb.Bin280]
MEKSYKLKVFCTFSSSAYKNNKKSLDKFIKMLETELDFFIEYRWFDNIDNDDYVKIFENSQTYLKKADLVVAEASAQSISVGQQLSLSKQLKKPTLVCIKRSNNESKPALLEGGQGPLFKILYYDNNRDLMVKIDNVLNKMLKKNQSALVKINFIATKQIKEKIFEISKSSNKSQSEILRNIVEKWIEQNNQQ